MSRPLIHFFLRGDEATPCGIHMPKNTAMDGNVNCRKCLKVIIDNYARFAR